MMPLRFVLAFPSPGPTSEKLTVVDNPRNIRGSGPTIWHDPRTPCAELADDGKVLGITFSREKFRQADHLDAPSTRNAEARARRLVRLYWGGYCAILPDRESGSWTVLVDPSGLLPVYRFATPTHVLLTSDPALLAGFHSGAMSVCFQAMGAHLLRPELRQRLTCLRGIEELTPGILYHLDRPAEPARTIWSALDFLPRGPAPAFETAAEGLRTLAVAVMGSWSDLFGRVSVAASGGVDSSLICAALAGAGEDFDCVTVATADRSGDERAYARELAAKLQVRCAERLYDSALFDCTRPASARLPRPARRAFLSVLDAVLNDAMQELGATVVLDGNGGDNLFCFLHSAAPVVDRLRSEGLSNGLARTVLDMCRITGCSVPTMLKATLRRLGRRQSQEWWPPDERFLTPEAAKAPWEALTPWLDRFEDRRSGKHDHMRLIMHAQNHIHGLSAGLPRLSPLASQPLIEFCLSIPTWLWAEGGVNRALARTAFASDLPAAILGRTSKAGPDSFIRDSFAANYAVIRERLLDGLLAAHYVIDRSAVERALAVDSFTDETVIDRLLDLLEAENWSRSWTR